MRFPTEWAEDRTRDGKGKQLGTKQMEVPGNQVDEEDAHKAGV